MKDLRTLVNEIDLRTIQQNNVRGFPATKARQNLVATVNANSITFTPFEESKAVQVKAQVVSHGHRYLTSIRFNDVGFEPVINNEPGVVEFEGTDGVLHHMHPVLQVGDDVEVSCTCMDFRFRFSNQHFQNKSLDGNPPPPYIRKTKNRPPVNPDDVIGACKHLLATAVKLRQMGILR
jgi:hypothetical protein